MIEIGNSVEQRDNRVLVNLCLSGEGDGSIDHSFYITEALYSNGLRQMISLVNRRYVAAMKDIIEHYEGGQ